MIAVAVCVLVVGFVALRRRRRSTLAGLNVDRPSFAVAPPTRWSTSGKDHRL